MASITRQPFAPLNEARIQSLTSLKNRQNAASPPVSKRKAESLDIADFENVDPNLFAKRSKPSGDAFSKDLLKPVNYFVTKTVTPAVSTPQSRSVLSPARSLSTPKKTLQAKSQAAKLNSASTTKTSSPSLFTPAGRSPTRGKKAGLISSRRRSSPFTRINPHSSSSSAAPFSLDAALKGTIPSYTSRQSTTKTTASLLDLGSSGSSMKDDWFFDIHEDTPEQELTNLLQHGTCVLDISSDEESARRERRDKADDKENIAPVDDVSQTTSSRRARARDVADDMMIEKERVALGEMDAREFFADGCDETSVVFIPEDEETEVEDNIPQDRKGKNIDHDFAPELQTLQETTAKVDELINNHSPSTEKAAAELAVLLPVEGTSESFEVWDSGSFTGEPDLVAEAAVQQETSEENQENAVSA